MQQKYSPRNVYEMHWRKLVFDRKIAMDLFHYFQPTRGDDLPYTREPLTATTIPRKPVILVVSWPWCISHAKIGSFWWHPLIANFTPKKGKTDFWPPLLATFKIAELLQVYANILLLIITLYRARHKLQIAVNGYTWQWNIFAGTITQQDNSPQKFYENLFMAG